MSYTDTDTEPTHHVVTICTECIERDWRPNLYGLDADSEDWLETVAQLDASRDAYLSEYEQGEETRLMSECVVCYGIDAAGQTEYSRELDA